jgi:hypothetical protein
VPRPPSSSPTPSRLPERPVTIWLLVTALVAAGLLVFGVAVSQSDVSVSGAPEFARAGYCSVAGNLSADGTPLQQGTFLDLFVGDPGSNGRYAGAVPANFVEGLGLTCSAPPPGYIHDGFAGDEHHVTPGIHPYYRPGP